MFGSSYLKVRYNTGLNQDWGNIVGSSRGATRFVAQV